MGEIRFDGIAVASDVRVSVRYEIANDAPMACPVSRHPISPTMHRVAHLLRETDVGTWEPYGPPIPNDVVIEHVKDGHTYVH